MAAEATSTPWIDGMTIGQVLRHTAQRLGERDAVVFPRTGFRRTWAEFDEEVDQVARGLLALGFGPGDHFGVWSTNWPEWVLLQYATARIGVVLVTVNPAYRSSELAYALAQSEIRGLALIEEFKSSRFFEMLDEICPELRTSHPGELHAAKFPKLKWVVCMRGADHAGLLPWPELVAAGDPIPREALARVEQQVKPDGPINLQFTSGTTGRPKGALLTHRNLLYNAYYCGGCQRITSVDRICIPVPLYHCFGCVMGSLCAMIRGAAMVFPNECFLPDATIDAIEAERCTSVYGVPTMFIAELEHPQFAGRNLSTLRTGIMAGSPCLIELMKRVANDMGIREITIGYGQTEASPLITMTNTDDPLEVRVGTVGRPLPGVEVQVVDPATGDSLPDGQSGELCCRGHNVMQGYYNLPEATAAAIDEAGWLHTGDIALRQPDGYLRITGRLKDMIIRGGENVAPREIEELLYQHPKVEEAHVFGVPDRKFGEEIVAWIKLREGTAAIDDEMRDFCRAHLAHFKAPRYVKFVTEFPTTVTGKIQKYKMREQAIVELGLEAVARMETA